MKVTIAAIGKIPSQSPQHMLIQGYQKRLPWQIVVKEGEGKRGLKSAKLQADEGKWLRDAVPSNSRKIIVDERGKAFNSREFAQYLTRSQEEGYHDIAFLIGGADGHEQQTRQEGDMLLSLGNMVWPHKLVRVMLMEQLYRAHTIMTGHPYHRD